MVEDVSYFLTVNYDVSLEEEPQLLLSMTMTVCLERTTTLHS